MPRLPLTAEGRRTTGLSLWPRSPGSGPDVQTLLSAAVTPRPRHRQARRAAPPSLASALAAFPAGSRGAEARDLAGRKRKRKPFQPFSVLGPAFIAGAVTLGFRAADARCAAVGPRTRTGRSGHSATPRDPPLWGPGRPHTPREDGVPPPRGPRPRPRPPPSWGRSRSRGCDAHGPGPRGPGARHGRPLGPPATAGDAASPPAARGLGSPCCSQGRRACEPGGGARGPLPGSAVASAGVRREGCGQGWVLVFVNLSKGNTVPTLRTSGLLGKDLRGVSAASRRTGGRSQCRPACPPQGNGSLTGEGPCRGPMPRRCGFGDVSPGEDTGTYL